MRRMRLKLSRQSRCLQRLSWAMLLALFAPSVCAAAVSANLASVDIGLGGAVTVYGQSVGPALGGLLYWNQDQTEAPSLWNGRGGFSTGSFVSIALGTAGNPNTQVSQAYEFHALTAAPSGTPSGPERISPLAAAYIGQLWDRHIQEVVNAKNVGFRGPRRTMIGALQTAIWKLVYDEGLNLDLSSGNVQATDNNPTSRLAQQWLDELQGPALATPSANLVALVGANGQVHITQSAATAQTLVEEPVPEPASFAAWLTLGCTVLIERLRRRRIGARGMRYLSGICNFYFRFGVKNGLRETAGEDKQPGSCLRVPKQSNAHRQLFLRRLS